MSGRAGYSDKSCRPSSIIAEGQAFQIVTRSLPRRHHEILHNRDLHPNMVILGSLTSPTPLYSERRKREDTGVAAEAGLF
jgi:hypothetical protein